MKYTNEERLNYAANNQSEYKKNEIAQGVDIGDYCKIGRDGFGWARDKDGSLVKIPHKGNIVIERNVTIGSNVCIDRAVTGSTVIGEGTKIDNLVHIAHGAKIGKHCLIVAGVVIGGSSEIGDYSYIGMGALIKNKVTIGKNVLIGMGAVVTKDVPDNEIWVGNPAKFLRKNE